MKNLFLRTGFSTETKTHRQTNTGLLIRRSLVRVQVGEPDKTRISAGFWNTDQSAILGSVRNLVRAMVVLAMFLPNAASADEWSTGDKVREGIYLGIRAADWAQTRYIARNPRDLYEKNIGLGEHPSVARVDTYFIGTAILHVTIANALPAEWRAPFQYITIGDAAGYVQRNHVIGIKIKF